MIDGARLAEDVGKAVTALNKDGHEVVTVSEILSGAYNHNFGLFGVDDGPYGYGYGYSYTEGVIIIGKKKP